jgi:hypothetical protein
MLKRPSPRLWEEEMTPNKADAPNPATGLLFQNGRHERRVGDLRR